MEWPLSLGLLGLRSHVGLAPSGNLFPFFPPLAQGVEHDRALPSFKLTPIGVTLEAVKAHTCMSFAVTH